MLKRKTVLFEETLLERVKQVSKELGFSVNDYLRWLINEDLRKKEREDQDMKIRKR